MNIFNKIKLSARYGKGIYIISGILTLAACVLVVSDPFILPACFILKILSIPVLLYLYASFQKGLTIYFYLNLGISRIEYYTIPFIVESIFFVISMIASASIAYVIG